MSLKDKSTEELLRYFEKTDFDKIEHEDIVIGLEQAFDRIFEMEREIERLQDRAAQTPKEPQ